MKFFNLVAMIVLLVIVACTNQKNSNQRQGNTVIMAYYVAERNYQPELLPVEKLTHIIYSFTNVIDGEMQFRNPEIAGPKLRALVAQKERNPNLKVMIACGGWGADGFSDMALTVASRTEFIKSAIDFIEEYQLDGMDMDWEYPGISGAGTMAREEDKENFTALMRGLRQALDQLERPQTLTFASAGWKRYYNHIELQEVMKYVDYMNVMTYDQVSGVSMYTGHHTPLGDVRAGQIEGTPMHQYLKERYDSGHTLDPHPRSAQKIVGFLIEQGVNPGQIVIGAAFYGRVWKGVPPANNGLYQLSGGISIGWYAYHQIREKLESDTAYVRYWDEQAQAAYMYNATDSLMLSYDDTVSVALKARYAMEKGLGGIMFWELGNDTREKGSLLDAIYKASVSQ